MRDCCNLEENCNNCIITCDKVFKFTTGITLFSDVVRYRSKRASLKKIKSVHFGILLLIGSNFITHYRLFHRYPDDGLKQEHTPFGLHMGHSKVARFLVTMITLVDNYNNAANN